MSRSYLQSNKQYWEQGYTAFNPDHAVFRFFGRILKPDFPHALGGKLVEFGCGQGAAVNFFHLNGFRVRGIDISETDIGIAKSRYPYISDCFQLCDPDPKNNAYYGFEKDVAAITAFQSLYYFSDSDFEICLKKLYESLAPNGIFFATMMGEKSREFFENSVDAGDGLRRVNFKNDRLNVQNYFISFIKDEDHLVKKFHLFKPVHIGYYAAKFRKDEGDGFHYTFCGIK
jgi:SAM-dependent methyltransferase